MTLANAVADFRDRVALELLAGYHFPIENLPDHWSSVSEMNEAAAKKESSAAENPLRIQ